jgi:hypothetical protein
MSLQLNAPDTFFTVESVRDSVETVKKVNKDAIFQTKSKKIPMGKPVVLAPLNKISPTFNANSPKLNIVSQPSNVTTNAVSPTFNPSSPQISEKLTSTVVTKATSPKVDGLLSSINTILRSSPRSKIILPTTPVEQLRASKPSERLTDIIRQLNIDQSKLKLKSEMSQSDYTYSKKELIEILKALGESISGTDDQYVMRIRKKIDEASLTQK